MVKLNENMSESDKGKQVPYCDHLSFFKKKKSFYLKAVFSTLVLQFRNLEVSRVWGGGVSPPPQKKIQHLYI